MDKKNLVIMGLIIVILFLGSVIFLQDTTTLNPEAINNNQQISQTPPPPPPAEPPTPSPNPNDSESEATEVNDDFADNGWLLSSMTLNGTKVDMSVNVPQPLTLNFDKTKKTLSGFSGCNSFFASYSVAVSNKLSFSGIGSTKKACEETMTLEGKIFDAMENISKFTIEADGDLRLESTDGKTIIIYKQAI